VEYEANNSSDIEPLASSEIERVVLVSGASERERVRTFVVLGFLESDAVETADSMLRSEFARWGGWSAASMTVVCAVRRKGACGRGGGKRTSGELAVAAASTDADADRVARRELSPVTTAGHAIPSTMSLLDIGELAIISRKSLLSRWGVSYELSAPD